MKPAYGMKDFKVTYFTEDGGMQTTWFTARNERECITNFLACFKGVDIIDIDEE